MAPDSVVPDRCCGTMICGADNTCRLPTNLSPTTESCRASLKPETNPKCLHNSVSVEEVIGGEFCFCDCDDIKIHKAKSHAIECSDLLFGMASAGTFSTPDMASLLTASEQPPAGEAKKKKKDVRSQLADAIKAFNASDEPDKTVGGFAESKYNICPDIIKEGIAACERCPNCRFVPK
ncbi:hypothetical protein DM01DRAFT_1378714 [Hesseltinella vesiculosa]|uniref:Uncharacterized protein n=1 Tax=Hesseltinella vesiculosa TaxID=101127 RepID=A0A1X2G4K5_9FUNG|nr:hypothetical protein DM01DRAFT_1378714 [Hesseltinella vesiculosa]